jgi:hypothetical protein
MGNSSPKTLETPVIHLHLDTVHKNIEKNLENLIELMVPW